MNWALNLQRRLAAAAEAHPRLCFHSGWIPILLAVASGWWYAASFTVNVPMMDDWDFLPILHSRPDGTVPASYFWAQHNEHRMVIPKLIFHGAGTLTKYNLKPVVYLSILVLTGILAMVVGAFLRQCRSKFALWLLAPVAFLVFDWGQEQCLRWAILIQFVLVMASATATFLLLHQIRNESFHGWFAGALGTVAFASLCSTQGLFVWPVGAAQLCLLALPAKRKLKLLAVWAFFGGLMWWIYFQNYSRPSSSPPLTVSLDYFLLLVGRPLTSRIDMGIGLGTAVIVLAAIAGLTVWRRREWGRYSFWLAWAGYSLLTMAAIMLGRSGLGIKQCLESRYITMSIPLLAGAYILLVLQSLARPRLILVTAACTAIVLIAIGLRASAHNGYKAGNGLRHLLDRQAYILWTIDDQPDRAIKIYPFADLCREKTYTLRRFGVSVFADQEFIRKYSPPPTYMPKLAEPARCGIEGLGVTRDLSSFLLSGWALDARTNKPAGAVCLVMDDRVYPLYYGGDRQADGPGGGLTCGFSGSIRWDRLPREPRRVELRVLTADRLAYWSMPLWPREKP